MSKKKQKTKKKNCRQLPTSANHNEAAANVNHSPQSRLVGSFYFCFHKLFDIRTSSSTGTGNVLTWRLEQHMSLKNNMHAKARNLYFGYLQKNIFNSN